MAGLRADVRTGRRIARAEVRRSIRWYFQQPRAKIALALVVLFFGSIVVFVAVPTAYELGRILRVDDRFPLLSGLRRQMTVLVGVLTALFALRTVERLAHIDGEPLILTTTTPRAVVIGLLTAETARLFLWLGVPAGLVVAAFVVGAQTPLMVVTVPLGLAPVLAFAATAGYLLGIGTLYLSRFVPLSTSIKTIVYPLGFILLIVGSQVVPRLALAGDLPVSLAPLRAALLRSPFAAYADLFLLGTPVAQPLSLTAGVVFAGLLAWLPVGVTLAGRLAARFWTTDTSEHARSEAAATGATPTSVPRPFAWWPAGRIGWHHLRAGARSPRQFVHLVFLVFAFAPVVSSLVDSSGLAWLFALGGSILLGAILAGSAFGLNPFGDDQSVLPLLLVTETPPKRFVRGRLVAGLSVCLPMVVGLPAVIAFVGPQSLVETGVFVGVGLGLAGLSAAWAIGLGTLFPKYETQTLYGVETVVPSFLVLFGHNAAVGLLGIVSLILTGITLDHGLPGSMPLVGGGVLVVLLLVGTAVGAYVYAVRQYRTYDLHS